MGLQAPARGLAGACRGLKVGAHAHFGDGVVIGAVAGAGRTPPGLDTGDDYSNFGIGPTWVQVPKL